MPDLADGETTEMKGSAREPYQLRNVGGVYSCTCPAWRNQSEPIERRTCKHLKKLRGAEAEAQRIGAALSRAPLPADDSEATREGDDDAADRAPPLLLAQSWTNDIELSGWWMSEKLDGVRAYWDGRQFISRQGNVFHVPDWFAEPLPSVPLDGELWLARKAFQRTVSIVRRQDRSEHWRSISFLVFDAPAIGGPFEERLDAVRDLLGRRDAEHVQLHHHEPCRGLEHLREELARVEQLGGEGLMLREPGSHYEAGRSTTLLKVKTFHDAEARVVEHQPGAGRHKGRLGALGVELPDGTRFALGTGFSDAQRVNPPAIGSIVTFRYQELTDRGVPRFPSFVRVRSDTGSQTVSNTANDAASSAEVEPPATVRPSAKKKGKEKANPTGAVSAGASDSTSGVSANTGGGTGPRHFEFIDGGSAKFWEISREGGSVTVRFGRIGASGQTQTKTFGDEAQAVRHYEKLVAEKVAKGYAER